MQTFPDFFRQATGGRDPDGRLARIARDGLPDAVDAGADRTGVILAWLWRRLRDEHLDDHHDELHATTPRRLVYVLPPRSLVEPLAGDVRKWLASLALTDQVALYAPGGARDESHGEWRQDMHRPAIVIGTADVLVSKLLFRGHDTGMVLQPIDFALLINGAHWIVHDTRSCPQTTATLLRIAVLARRWGTAEPFRLSFIQEHSPERHWLLASRPAISAAVRGRHQEGTVTIVALSTVEAAQAVYRDLRGGPARCTLVHSRFRGVDRARILAEITAGAEDRIVVTTQTTEPGLGISAGTLIAETPLAAAPERWASVISETEFLGLFDTGADADVAPYVHDEEDPDVEVAWATWAPGERGEPDPEVRPPSAEYRCRVPLSLIPRLAAGRAVWRFDGERSAYVKITDAGQRPVRPGRVLLVNAAEGGYDPELGFVPESCDLVVDTPHMLTSAEQEEFVMLPEISAERRWQSLDEHSAQVRDQAAALLKVLSPDIPPDAARSVVVAAYLHDLGKAHPIWQDALCALAADDERAMVEADRPWAKSGGNGGRLEFAGDVAFRHELASLLIADGPLRHLLADAPDEDLTRYGILAHHGILRVRVTDPDTDAVPQAVRGLADGATAEIPPVLGQPGTSLTVDLAQFRAGDGDSAWTRSVLNLLARYGPFRLAYLETLVRIADWRASAGVCLPRTLSRGVSKAAGRPLSYEGLVTEYAYRAGSAPGFRPRDRSRLRMRLGGVLLVMREPGNRPQRVDHGGVVRKPRAAEGAAGIPVGAHAAHRPAP